MLFSRIKRLLQQKALRITGQPADEQMALQLLNPLFSNRPYIPLTEWAPTARLLAHLINDIIINKRQAILEFGTGVSTLLIARLIQINGLPTRLISVEHDPEWLSLQEYYLQRENLQDLVHLILAPIEQSPYTFQEHFQWYSTNTLAQKMPFSKIDLVLVDGPKGDTPYARFGAIPFAYPYLKDDFMIFLDDSQRSDERAILKEWMKLFPQVDYASFGNYSTLVAGNGFDALPLLATTKFI